MKIIDFIYRAGMMLGMLESTQLCQELEELEFDEIQIQQLKQALIQLHVACREKDQELNGEILYL